ncbi:hypothetical protein [Martelella alba]|uniref:Uncharacterized protein n=1 Tax=Martelella alba TaxID=2590451 RepID=A0ABY2SI67_9HYPH|nr:hypothetical protein [Martelella alba]TKI05042.1 hypothetical protein FCN80_16065 [Martelella alba]
MLIEASGRNNISDSLYGSLRHNGESRRYIHEFNRLLGDIKHIGNGRPNDFAAPPRLGRNLSKTARWIYYFTLSPIMHAGPPKQSHEISTHPVDNRSLRQPRTSTETSPPSLFKSVNGSYPPPLWTGQHPSGKLRRKRESIAQTPTSNEESITPRLFPAGVADNHILGYLWQKGWLPAGMRMSDVGLINILLDVIERFPREIITLAKSLLAGSGMYGGLDGEIIDQGYATETLHAWISSKLFHQGLPFYLAKLFSECCREAAISGQYFCHQNAFQKLLHLTIDPIMSFTETSEQPESITPAARQYILGKMVYPLLPTLTLWPEDAPQQIKMGTVEWGYYHVGASYMNISHLNVRHLDLEEYISLGILLETMLSSTVLAPSLIRLFHIPALFAYIQRHPFTQNNLQSIDIMQDGVVKSDIMEEFFSACDEWNMLKNPPSCYDEIVKTYKTRTQLAQEILTSTCRFEEGKDISSLISNYKLFPGSSFCWDNVIPGKERSRALPHLDELFQHQNVLIANAYYVVHKMLVHEMLNELGSADVAFLADATIVEMNASFRHDRMPVTAWGYLSQMEYNHLHLPRGIKIYSATREGEERCYAIHSDHFIDLLVRVDRNIDWYSNLIESDISQIDKKHLQLVLSPTLRGKMKAADQRLEYFVSKLARVHQKVFLRKIQDYGYDSTFFQKVKNFLYSLIPLRDCVNHIRFKEEEQAVVTCSADIVALLPLVGKGLNIAAKASMLLHFRTWIIMQKAFSSFALRETLHYAMEKSLITLPKYSLLPIAQNLNRKALSAYAVEVIKLFDPGIESLVALKRILSKNIFLVIKATRYRHPVLERLYHIMEPHFRISYEAASGNIDKLAYLSGSRQQIPIEKLIGDKFEGKEVYLRIDPGTGRIYGTKYILTEDNLLEAIITPKFPFLKHSRKRHLDEFLFRLANNTLWTEGR